MRVERVQFGQPAIGALSPDEIAAADGHAPGAEIPERGGDRASEWLAHDGLWDFAGAVFGAIAAGAAGLCAAIHVELHTERGTGAATVGRAVPRVGGGAR